MSEFLTTDRRRQIPQAPADVVDQVMRDGIGAVTKRERTSKKSRRGADVKTQKVSFTLLDDTAQRLKYRALLERKTYGELLESMIGEELRGGIRVASFTGRAKEGPLPQSSDAAA